MRESLYLAIGKYKEKTGKTQGKIGLEVGMVESRLCYIVRGKRDPTPTEMKKLALILGVPEEILFEDSKNIPTAAEK
jgi:transcriptional regulator with XRE-family HTH domain